MAQTLFALEYVPKGSFLHFHFLLFLKLFICRLTNQVVLVKFPVSQSHVKAKENLCLIDGMTGFPPELMLFFLPQYTQYV